MRAALITLIVIVLLAAIINGCWSFGLRKAKILVFVVDDDGKPVNGANIQASFSLRYQVNEAARFDNIFVNTDSAGRATLANKTSGNVGWVVRSPGYYPYRNHVAFVPQSMLREGSWRHTNTAVLKRVIKPVPMFHGGGGFVLPAFGQPCGFDLELKDWVAPFGKGVRVDLIFTGTNRFVTELDREVVIKLTFPGRYDGIIPLDIDLERGSELRTPRYAPESGYLPELVMGERVGGGQPTTRTYEINGRKRAYFIRVRSETDASGSLKRAWYGTILSEFEVFSISPDTVRIRFGYYLNPTPNDRNLERDPEKTVSSLVP